MNLVDCYRLLGLSSGAHPGEIKQSYRRLAREYHPDINPENPEAQAKFIQLTQAYQYLLKTEDFTTFSSDSSSADSASTEPSPTPTVEIPLLSAHETRLKWSSYQSLKQILGEGRFARAIALVEGLAQRLPQDPEVRQWQAITYQQWGRQLLKEGQINKGKIYFKKALQTDPYNRSLWAEITRELDELKSNKN